jgi:alpha-D-ribose 1-methylphosphonate 5-triphosphate synthase subunit PhnG
MAIDTKPFVELAERHNSRGYTHFEGCEHYHASCAILYLAGALDAAQKRLDEYAAEIQRLRAENAEARAFNAPLIRDWEGEAEDEAWKGLGNA